ncbi:hypothetical protein CEUSTIGMA_g7328.t1 [Chlamydomonas eustigma]|uniref:VOC domain-containing protein n=1 Tax=Chlamydomonas eustigma TaxID=1157962 RepID=A0A250X9Y3_9CHLO|nr:hypothetical protein CEUSTIGMA_g7328.t1 [Chlamydomonas eustigma]|eukprot:GAX79888.1 hypothetical protein CEUSTIGMA_g7328.t1 [Chlamydomonas eustigma]
MISHKQLLRGYGRSASRGIRHLRVHTSCRSNFGCKSMAAEETTSISFTGVHHVAVICKNLEESMDFYQRILGLPVNPDRPHDKLPYRGAWLMIGPEMVHLMELPNPDPLEGRPEHGGRDRHFCAGIQCLRPLIAKLEAEGIKYTMSKSGRPAAFFRDPDMNTLEVVEIEPWR